MTARPSGARRAANPRRSPRRGPVEGPIRFGTSGWRGVLGEEVTFGRLRVLVRAVAEWVRSSQRGRRVAVGYDRRFASRAMAEAASAVLVEAGLRPELAARVTPTPVITHALARGRHAAGLVLTASHNPAPDHGLKVFAASGACIEDRVARRIEAIATRRMGETAAPARTAAGVPRARSIDFDAAYLEDLAALLDADALRRSSTTLVYDAMHGAAGGFLDALMRRLGVAVEAMRTEVDPLFGGAAPDPVAPRLGDLVEATRCRSGLVLGIANDGDGDRVGVVDGRGRVLSETQVLALLVDHLARRGRIERGVAIGAATGTLVEKVARDHGLAVERHPIGFKHLSAAILAGRADVAGEESGGFAFAAMGPDKDGILAGALLVELVASSGQPLEVHLAQLESRFGSSACGRIALAWTPSFEMALERLTSRPPDRLGGVGLAGVDRACGLRFALADGGFLMFRRSGTEPLVRVYAEAGDPQRLALRLRQGERLLARAAR
ncbi:MAG: hypothetical protein R3F35_03005 [Myxococcota bacterium]